MSSIIDALKKSDQSRNTDQSNSLDNISFSDQPAHKSRRGFWLLVLVLLLVALAVFGWQQGWHHTIKNLITSTTGQSRESVTPSTVSGAAEPARNMTESPRLTPPKQQEIKQKTRELANQAGTQKPAATSQESNTLSAAQDTPKPAENNTLTVIENRNNSGSPAAQPDKDTTAEQPPKTPSEKEGMDHPDNLQPQQKQDYLYIHQLDFSIRKNIPNVKISIHIYDPEPDNRMLMIGGEKFAIGDNIEGILTVHDIVPEGVVLAFENIRFLLPK